MLKELIPIAVTFIAVASGIAVFIFALRLLSTALRDSFAAELSRLLAKFTKNRFSACLTGALVTAAMQSSSASTVMTAALADSGVISVYSALWIVIGANVGTTLTGLLTAADFTGIAPLFSVAGALLLSFGKKKKLCAAGSALMGLGLMFVGMNIMNGAVRGLESSAFISELLKNCGNPVTGVLNGALVTAVIQSSAALTAILQTLSVNGAVGIRQAYYIILGANIGTCATSAVAAMGLKSSAKKVAAAHIIFNLAGSLFFVLIAAFIPVPELIAEKCAGGIKTQIAAVNIIINIVSAAAALCLPLKKPKAKSPAAKTAGHERNHLLPLTQNKKTVN